MKRILSILLCLSMLLSYVPVGAFATTEDETLPVETTVETEAPQEEEPAAAPQETVAEPSAEDAAEETTHTTEAVTETTDATEAPVEATVAEEEITVSSDTVTAQSGQMAAEETVPEETQAEEITVATYTYVPELDLPDDDELFAMYAEHLLYGTAPALLGTAAGETLTGDIKLAYDALVPFVKDVANGKRSEAIITVGYDLGKLTFSDGSTEVCDAEIDVAFTGTKFDEPSVQALLNALLSDLPYDMYWCDKTWGISTSVVTLGSKMHLTFYFTVAANYSSGGNVIGGYSANTTKTAGAATAAANALDIVSKYANASDYEKLVGYKTEICTLTSYNTSAASNGNFSVNNDPWQLIYVFDNKSNTKVVCEGYAKAFQYLCDLTDFDGKVSCYLVTGQMAGGTGAGPHMWNIVSIDGKNYLADVTNSDSGTIGSSGSLFLVGKPANADGSYTFSGVTFAYDESTTSLWDSSILTLAQENYDPNAVTAMTQAEFVAELEAAVEAGTYTLTNAVVLTSDLDVPSGVALQIGKGGDLTVSSNVTLFTEDDIAVLSGGTLTIADGGSVDSWGYAYVHKGGTLTNRNEFSSLFTVYVGDYTQAEFEALMASAENGELYFGSDLTLTDDLVIPAGIYVTFQDTSLTIPRGKTLTIDGSLVVFNRMTVENGGALVLEGDGVLAVPGAVFTIEDGASYTIGENAAINASDGTTLIGISRGETINSNMIMDPSTDLESFAALGKDYKKFLLSIDTDYTISEDVNLYSNVVLDHHFFTVTITNGATVTINNDWIVGSDFTSFGGGVYPGYIVVEDGTLILNGTLTLDYGSTLTICEGASVIANTEILCKNGGTINGTLTEPEVPAEDKFMEAVRNAQMTGESLTVWDEITLKEDLTINMAGQLSFADFAKLVVPSGVTLTLNCPTNINGAELIVEEGAKLISNVDLTINDPQGNGGKAIFNGEFVNNGSFWVNTGSFADINGYAESNGPIFVGFGGSSRLSINGQLDTTAYLCVNEGGSLHLSEGAKLNLLGIGGGYLDNQGYSYLGGDVYMEYMMTSGARRDEQTGEVVGDPATIEIRGSVTGTATSTIGVGEGGNINCYGPVTTAGEVQVDREGALWVDNTVNITGPGALRNNGAVHVDFIDEFATADGVLNVDTETHVNGYLAVHEGGTLNVSENATVGIYNNENGCGYLENQGSVTMNGHLYLEGLFFTGAACDENGNVVGAPATAQFNWYVDTTETSSFGVLNGGTVTIFGVNNAGEFRTETGGKLIFPENVCLDNHGGMVSMAEETAQFEGSNFVYNHMDRGFLGSVSGVPYENLVADVHAYSADQVYTLFEIASPEEYCDITAIVEDSMVFDRDLTIPEVGFINVVAWDVPSTTVTIPEGVTIINNGYIYVLDNTKLVVDGTIEGNPPENLGGTITGSHFEVSAEKLEQQLQQKGHADLSSRLVLTRDLEIPAGAVLNICDGGQLIVPGGKMLTVEGALHITQSVDKEGNSQPGLLLEGGKLINNGLIAVHDLGYLDASNGTYAQADWAQLHRVYLGDDNGSQIPSEIIGIPMKCATLIADYTNPEVIRVVLAIASEAETIGDPFRQVHINVGRDMTLNENLTIPENGYLRIENSTVTVPANVTLTNNGMIEIGWNGKLVIADGAALVGGLPMVSNGGEYVNAQPYTEDAFRADLEKAAETGRELFLCRNLTLTKNLLIPAGTVLTIGDGGKLIVPSGITLTVEGDLHITNSIDLGGIADPGLVVDGGKLVNNGLIVTRDYGILDAANGTYAQADWAQMQRVYYSPDNGGDVFPSEIIGIPNSYIDLILNNVDGEVLPNLLKIADAQLSNGDPFRSVQINVTDREQIQYVDLTIPAYARMHICNGGTLVIPAGVTLTNFGSIDIGWAGRLVIEQGGAIVGNHPSCYDTGAEYINENVYDQTYLESLIANAASDGNVVLSVPVRLERDLEIPSDVVLTITGRDAFLTIPKGVTLTNRGRIICQMFGGILGQGGELHNAGDIQAINWGTVDMSQGSFTAAGGRVYNTHICDEFGNVSHATVLVPPECMTIVAETYSDDGVIREMIDYANGMVADGHAPWGLALRFMGNAYLTGDLELPDYSSPVIPAGSVLVVPSGVTLVDHSGMAVYGTLYIEGNVITTGWPIATDDPANIVNPSVDMNYYVMGTAMEDYTIGCSDTVSSTQYGIELWVETYEPEYAEFFGEVALEILEGEDAWTRDGIVFSNVPGKVVVAVKPVIGYDYENNYEPIFCDVVKTIELTFLDQQVHLYYQSAEDVDFFEDGFCGLYGGSSIRLFANRTGYANDIDSTLQWELEGAENLVTMKQKNGVVTFTAAKNLTSFTSVLVTAKTADDSAAEFSTILYLRPQATAVEIERYGNLLTGKTLTFDLNRDLDPETDGIQREVIYLNHLVSPMDAVATDIAAVWSSSNEDVAIVDENGMVIFTGEPGTVKITVTTNYGAKKTATVTFKAVELVQRITSAKTNVTELIGGKGATFTAEADGKTLKASEVTWFLCDEWGNAIASHPYASINAKGKLTTKAVADETKVYLMAQVVGNADSAMLDEPITVTLYPAITGVDVSCEELGTIPNNEKLVLDLDFSDKYTVHLNIYPDLNAVKSIEWKSAKPDVATVAADAAGMDAMITPVGPGTSKITVTVTALDGKKTTTAFTFTFGNFVEEVEVKVPGTMHGGEKATLEATVLTKNADNKNVVWSLVNSADKAYVTLSKNTLTAKKVTNPVYVPICLTSKDGWYYDEFLVEILPEDPEELLIQTGWGEYITGTTRQLTTGETLDLSANASVTWSSDKKDVAAVDAFGTVTAVGNGTAKITATANDGRTATVTIKVGKVSNDVEITTKKGGDFTVASGKTLELAAKVFYNDGSTSTKDILWEISDPSVATIKSGKLTAAKNLTAATSVDVYAFAKDGYALGVVNVEITPLATGVEIYGPFDTSYSGNDNVDVSNTTQKVDMAEYSSFYLHATVFPFADARQDVTWKSSSPKVASVDADGKVTCLKSGTVTITATAKDGSGKKASFKLTVFKSMEYLTLPESAFIAGGKSLTMTKLDGYSVDTLATNKNLIWGMTDVYGYPVSKTVATLSNKGVLKTKAVTAPVPIFIWAEAADGSGLVAECTVTIYPAIQGVALYDMMPEPIQNKSTISWPTGEEFYFFADSTNVNTACWYEDARDVWTVTSSKNDIATVSVDEFGLITVNPVADENGRYKTGTVKITVKANDGSGKSAYFSLKFE